MPIGTGYVEYEEPADAVLGLQGCNGKRLGIKKLWCEFTQVAAKGKDKPEVVSSDTVFCGNIGFYTEEQAICDFFADIGTVVDIVFAYNEDGTTRGFCHIQFESPE